MSLDSPRAAAVAGVASGACQVLAEHPLDSLKIRLQSQLSSFTGVHGGLGMLRHTVQGESAAALFQGLTPRLLTYSAVKLSLFSLYESLLPLCGSPAAAGALAGACNTLVACPQDVLKSRLQIVQVSRASRCPAPVDLAAQLLRAHGPLVFYRGWGALVIRDTVGYALLFSVFHAGRKERNLPPWLVGGCAGLAFYLSTLPIDRNALRLEYVRPARPLLSV